MRGNVKSSRLLMLGLAMMIGLAGCGNPFSSDRDDGDEIIERSDGRVLWESNLEYVKIVNRDMSGPSNSHPADLSREDVRTLLESLYVNQRVLLRQTQVPVFAESELQILSDSLSRALANAESSEDVTFVTLGTHQGTIARERKSNSGRVFIDQDGRLNIIFGLLHEEYREKDQYTGQDIDRRVNPLKPGMRRSESDLDRQIAMDNGLAFHQEDGEERRDWVVMDIDTVLATARERTGQDEGTLTPEIRETIESNQRQTRNLEAEMGELKELMFDMSGEIERLREELQNRDQAE